MSYFTARPSRDLIIAGRQETTRSVWSRLDSTYDCYVSVLVLEEAGHGDQREAALRLEALKSFQILDIDDEARALATQIVELHGVPREFPEDALHVAVAAVNSMDLILTWNFAHLNNPFTRNTVRRIVEDAGYVCPEICSPDELLEADQ